MSAIDRQPFILAERLHLPKTLFLHRGWHSGIGQLVGLFAIVYAIINTVATTSITQVVLAICVMLAALMIDPDGTDDIKDMPAWVPPAIAAAILNPMLACSLLVYAVCGVSVSVFFHRWGSHAAFKTKRWKARLGCLFATIVGSGSLLQWCGSHDPHHIYSDMPGDPHNYKGWWSAWLVNYAVPPKYAHQRVLRLMVDPFQVFLHYNYWLVNATYGLLLWSIGGVPALVYLWLLPAGALLIMGGIHNVVAHAGDGTRRFPIDLHWYAPFSFGEWAHGTHHKDPQNPDFRPTSADSDFGYSVIKAIRTD